MMTNVPVWIKVIESPMARADTMLTTSPDPKQRTWSFRQ